MYIDIIKEYIENQGNNLILQTIKMGMGLYILKIEKLNCLN